MTAICERHSNGLSDQVDGLVGDCMLACVASTVPSWFLCCCVLLCANVFTGVSGDLNNPAPVHSVTRLEATSLYTSVFELLRVLMLDPYICYLTGDNLSSFYQIMLAVGACEQDPAQAWAVLQPTTSQAGHSTWEQGGLITTAPQTADELAERLLQACEMHEASNAGMARFGCNTAEASDSSGSVSSSSSTLHQDKAPQHASMSDGMAADCTGLQGNAALQAQVHILILGLIVQFIREAKQQGGSVWTHACPLQVALLLDAARQVQNTGQKHFSTASDSRAHGSKGRAANCLEPMQLHCCSSSGGHAASWLADGRLRPDSDTPSSTPTATAEWQSPMTENTTTTAQGCLHTSSRKHENNDDVKQPDVGKTDEDAGNTASSSCKRGRLQHQHCQQQPSSSLYAQAVSCVCCVISCGKFC